jgi:ZIP family zinc transporter
MLEMYYINPLYFSFMMQIPEGIAIAIPCLAARPDRPWLSFLLAGVSGLAEPAGAIVAVFFLKDVDSQSRGIISLQNVLGFVAGIMVTVSLVELFPHAIRHSTETKKYFWGGTLLGIIIMVTTELYLE